MTKVTVPEELFDIEDDDILESGIISWLDADDTSYFYEDEDQQDGRFYRAYEKEKIEPYSMDTFDAKSYIRKSRAVLYLHLHQELMSDRRYKQAYDRLRDDNIRSCAYWMEHCAVLGRITEEDREAENFVLDMELKEKGEVKVNKYKKDAIYIVNLIASGESIFT